MASQRVQEKSSVAHASPQAGPATFARPAFLNSISAPPAVAAHAALFPMSVPITPTAQVSRNSGWNFGKVAVSAADQPGHAGRRSAPARVSVPPSLQRKLRIGASNDPLEHEADRAADNVMRMPVSAPFTRQAPLQVSRMCTECKEEEEKKLQAKPAPASTPATGEAPGIVHDVLRSPGQPLDRGTQTFFGTRFGHDFGHVRVHTDVRAQKSAAAVNAQAYTVGRHIVFGEGLYAPHTPQGRKLLAHELVHTLQQGPVAETRSQKLDTEPDGSPAELEANRLSGAALTGGDASRAAASPLRPSGPPASPNRLYLQRRGSAGGCGICLGGDSRAAGQIAHTEIELAFHAMYPDMHPGEFPVPVVPEGEVAPFQPEVDLMMEEFALGQHIIHIGEIKPLDDAGRQVEMARRQLSDYARELHAGGMFDEVFRMVLPPVPVPIPFFNPLNPPGCPPQLITVQLTEPGIYQYVCDPPWSELVNNPQCACGEKEDEETDEEKEKDKKKDEKDEEEKEKDKEETDEDEHDVKPPGLPKPEVWVPVAVFAILAAAMLRFGAKRVTGVLAAIAAVVLISSGAEASVGGEGDDPLEAVFKLAEQKGAKIPDDLKEAIKKDPELKRIMTQAAQTGNFSEAKRQLGETLTRVIVENRDQFTDQEIEELLTVTNQNKDVIPNADATAAELRKALDASHARAAAAGQGSAGQGAGKATPTTDTSQASATDQAPAAKPDDIPAPAKRLISALTSGKGPALNGEQLQRLQSIVQSVTPALTDADVDNLIKKIAPADGQTSDDLLNSIQQTLQHFRSEKPAGDAGSGGQADAADAAGKNGAPAGVGPSVPLNTAAQKTQTHAAPLSPADQQRNDNLEKKFSWIAPGDAYIFEASNAHTVFKEGVAFTGFFMSRDTETKRIVMGNVKVTPKKASGGWILIVGAGTQLYDAAGSWGVSKRLEMPAVAGAGAANTGAPAAKPAGARQ